MESLAERIKQRSPSSSNSRRHCWVYQCPQCPRSYSNEAGAWQHNFVMHDKGVKIHQVRDWRVQRVEGDDSSLPKPRQKKKKVMKKRPKLQCPHCAQMVQDLQLQNHVGVHVGGGLQCPAPDCWGMFLSKFNLRDHMIRTHPSLPPTRTHKVAMIQGNHKDSPHPPPVQTSRRKLKRKRSNVRTAQLSVAKREEARRQKREQQRTFRAKLVYACDLCDKRYGQKPQLLGHKIREHFV